MYSPGISPKIISRLLPILLICGIALTLFPHNSSAEDNGREIMRQVIERYDGFNHLSGKMKMILTDQSGKQKHRQLEVFAQEMKDDGNRIILLFKKPKNVKGTALLIHSHYNGINDQWIYLPAFKRTKRIADKSKTSPFMGSEFSYEDLSNIELPMYTYNHIKDEMYKSVLCNIVELTPTYPNSAYSRSIVWVNQEKKRLEMIEYYDNTGRHCKTLTSQDYTLYKNKFWHPKVLTMVNMLNDKKTELILNDLNYETNLNDQIFLVNSLRSLDN